MTKSQTDSITADEKAAVAKVASKAATSILGKAGLPVAILAAFSSFGGTWLNSQNVATKDDINEVLEKIDEADEERKSMDDRLRETERELDRREFRIRALETK